MAIHLEIFTDDRGYLHARTAKLLQPLAWYLEEDIQSSRQHCDEILGICSRIAREGREWVGTGNAHTITITPQRVVIEAEFVDPPEGLCSLGLSEFQQAVSAWWEAIPVAEKG